jgi:cell division protein FtsW
MKKIIVIDKILGSLFLSLLLIGFAFFLSASFGVLANSPIKFVSMIKSQFILGLLGGIVCIFVVMKVPIKFWQKYSFWFFLGSLILTLLVFVPALSYSHGGASRWVAFGFVSFQPVEFLKAASILYLSVVYKKFLKKDSESSKNNSYSFLTIVSPALIIMMLITSALIFQPDTKNTVIMFVISFIILFIVGLLTNPDIALAHLMKVFSLNCFIFLSNAPRKSPGKQSELLS